MKIALSDGVQLSSNILPAVGHDVVAEANLIKTKRTASTGDLQSVIVFGTRSGLAN